MARDIQTGSMGQGGIINEGVGLTVLRDFYNPTTGKYFRSPNTAVRPPSGFVPIEQSEKTQADADAFFSRLRQEQKDAGLGPIKEMPLPSGPDNRLILPPSPPTPQPTLTDPSQFAQAQVGAAVRQPTLPEGGAVLPNLALQSVVPNQLQTTPGLQGTVAAATPAATTAPMVQGAAVPSASQVTQASVPTANTYDYTATTTAGQLPQATAAQGTVTQPMVAAQEDLTSLPPEATVQGQLANISQSITDAVNQGTALPAFAQGAKRLVDSAMQQRGLGASSIAAEALAQGIISASIPIAQQDAATYKDAIFANLNNRQQAALTNANAYLQMDMANLNNTQQTSLANLQIRQQSLFSDQAAQNAASQFNSQSLLQRPTKYLHKMHKIK